MAKSLLIPTVSLGAVLLCPVFAQNAERVGPGRLHITAEQAASDQQEVRHSSPTVRVTKVEFVSDAPLPAKAEARLTRYITSRAIYDDAGWVDELEQRVKDAWQQYGYFQPDVQTSVRKLGQYTVEHNFA